MHNNLELIQNLQTSTINVKKKKKIQHISC